jgi:hypothetical protein
MTDKEKTPTKCVLYSKEDGSTKEFYTVEDVAAALKSKKWSDTPKKAK